MNEANVCASKLIFTGTASFQLVVILLDIIRVPGNNFGQSRRNFPCSLQRNCQHLFLTLLSREPFTDAFYYSSFLPNGIRPPNGLKQVKVTNALARLNTIEFHDRNGTVGRLWTEVTMEATRLHLFNE